MPNEGIVVADVSFRTAVDRQEAGERLVDAFGDDEYYWARDETVDALGALGLRVAYSQVSDYGACS